MIMSPVSTTDSNENLVMNNCADEKYSTGNPLDKDVPAVLKDVPVNVSNESCSLSHANEGTVEDVADEEIVVQDPGCTLKIQPPTGESFELQMSKLDLVQEIYQVLLDKEETCHRTCFSLKHNGQQLDNFAELKTYSEIQDGSVIDVVEEPYTVRETKIHIRHINDLIKSLDYCDAYAGLDCKSVSCLPSILEGEISGDVVHRKRQKSGDSCLPPAHLLPTTRERHLNMMLPQLKDILKSKDCIKLLSTSPWNPPPGNRRLHGDLMYLHVITIEDKRFYITASTRGFFANQSTSDCFNPKQANSKQLCHSLADLLMQLSAGFKRNFTQLLKKRANKHLYERMPTSYQQFSWIVPLVDHATDLFHAENQFNGRLGYEDQIPGQLRDWNEEHQSTREMPRDTLPSRIIRERSIFKVHGDFVAAATRGAMCVVDGNVLAINPGEDHKQQMFIWNNIFFSLGFDVKDHYKDFGGDLAAYYACGTDLTGVKVFSDANPEGLFMLGTCIVDYRGFRVVCQSIVPGILEREQEESVIYGSVDFGETVIANEQYNELMEKLTSKVRALPHKVISKDGDEVTISTSVECKGISGNDRRLYILDLIRMFPPDVNFLADENEEICEEVRKLGFPRKHCHRFPQLRQELLDSFHECRCTQFMRNAASYWAWKRKENQLKELSQNPTNGHSEEDAKTVDQGTVDKKTHQQLVQEAQMFISKILKDGPTEFTEEELEVARLACNSVGSLQDTSLDLRFNLDIFQLRVKLPDYTSEQFKKQKQLIKDAARYIVIVQIPGLLNECLDGSNQPIDSISLRDLLHAKGINIRYLGVLAALSEPISELTYIYRLCIAEIINRCTKHILKVYLQNLDLLNTAAAISFFLNCYLGSCPGPHVHFVEEGVTLSKNKKNTKKKGKLGPSIVMDEMWNQLTPQVLWEEICKEAQSYYKFTITVNGIDEFVSVYNIQKVTLLRQLCLSIGMQIQLRNYTFDSKTKPPFTEDDIVNMFPLVKHIDPRASDAHRFLQTGESKISQGLLKEGYEMIAEALNMFNNVYGPLHQDIGQCLRTLGHLNYVLGDMSEALSTMQRACLMTERCLGPDHPAVVSDYTLLSMYTFASGKHVQALNLAYRSRYLSLLLHDESHPQLAVIDGNIGVMLAYAGELDVAIKYLDNSLDIFKQFFGGQSLKVAFSHHLLACCYSSIGDFRTALQSEKEAYSIYRQQLGDVHQKTKDSSDILRNLTQQAVMLQKTLNGVYQSKAPLPALSLTPPPFKSCVEFLNSLNGVFFLNVIRLSPEEIERLSEAVEKDKKVEKTVSGSPDCVTNDYMFNAVSPEHIPAEKPDGALPIPKQADAKLLDDVLD